MMLKKHVVLVLLSAGLATAVTLGAGTRSEHGTQDELTVVRIDASDFAFALDRTIILAGPVHFELTNLSGDYRHEVWIYPIDERDGYLFHEMLNLKRTGGRADEPNHIDGIVGRSGEVVAGDAASFLVNLPPGVYEVGCFVREGTGAARMVHYDQGMYAVLAVRPTN